MAVGFLVAGIVFLFVVIISLIILGLVFWIFMLVDCAKRDFKNDNEKIVWIIIIALLGILGATIYYFVVKLNDKKNKPQKKNKK